MEKAKLVVKHREASGTRAARRLRRQGLIPGVLYGHGKSAVALAVEPASLREALATEAGTHAILEVLFEDQKKVHRAIVKDLQLDKVRHVVTHVDLQEVRLDEVVESKVALRFEGAAKGVKMGGILDEALREVTVKGRVTEIPESLPVDISELGVGDTLHVADLTPPEGIEILDDPELVLCSILAPRAVVIEEVAEEEAAAAAPEAAEPEVIGKPKEGEAEE